MLSKNTIKTMAEMYVAKKNIAERIEALKISYNIPAETDISPLVRIICEVAENAYADGLKDASMYAQMGQ